MGTFGVKTGGKDFKKGDPRCNRKGRPKLSKELKEIKKQNNEELTKLLTYLVDADEKRVKEIAQDKKIALKTRILLKLVENAAKKADTNTVNFIWDRIGEKLTQKQELTGAEGGPINIFYTDEEERKKRIEELLSKKGE